jgi:hypothetical protein
MIEDDGFETVVGLPKRKVYNVEVEGVVTRIYRVEAANSAKASELARSEFIIDLGGNKDAVYVNDVWKD